MPVFISNSFCFTQTHLEDWCWKSQICNYLLFFSNADLGMMGGSYANYCWLCRCSRTEQWFPAGRGRLWRGWRRTTEREGREEKAEITAANLDSASLKYLWCHNRHDDKNERGAKDVTQVRYKGGGVFKKWMFRKLTWYLTSFFIGEQNGY